MKSYFNFLFGGNALRKLCIGIALIASFAAYAARPTIATIASLHGYSDDKAIASFGNYVCVSNGSSINVVDIRNTDASAKAIDVKMNCINEIVMSEKYVYVWGGDNYGDNTHSAIIKIADLGKNKPDVISRANDTSSSNKASASEIYGDYIYYVSNYCYRDDRYEWRCNERMLYATDIETGETKKIPESPDKIMAFTIRDGFAYAVYTAEENDLYVRNLCAIDIHDPVNVTIEQMSRILGNEIDAIVVSDNYVYLLDTKHNIASFSIKHIKEGLVDRYYRNSSSIDEEARVSARLRQLLWLEVIKIAAFGNRVYAIGPTSDIYTFNDDAIEDVGKKLLYAGGCRDCKIALSGSDENGDYVYLLDYKKLHIVKVKMTKEALNQYKEELNQYIDETTQELDKLKTSKQSTQLQLLQVEKKVATTQLQSLQQVVAVKNLKRSPEFQQIPAQLKRVQLKLSRYGLEKTKQQLLQAKMAKPAMEEQYQQEAVSTHTEEK